MLVNSTGIFRIVPFLEQTEEHLEEALGSILYPTYWVSQAAAQAMRERGGGAIVSVGSMWAVDAIATTPTSAYSAAQAGRHALTKNLALELAAENIRVNTVVPRRAARWLAEDPPGPEPTEGGEDAHYAWRRDWQPPVRRRLGRAALAGRVRRPRRDADRVGDLLRGARPRAGRRCRPTCSACCSAARR